MPSSIAASSSSADVVRAAWLDRPFSPREKLGLIAEILGIYGRAWWWLRRDGMTAAVERLRAPSRRRPSIDGPGAYDAVIRLSRIVMRTLAPLPTDTRCLARSLVLTGLLARRGVATTLVIGVAPQPDFAAHAWIEYLGCPALPAGGDTYERLLEI